MPPFHTALTIAHTNPASKFHLLSFQVSQPEFNFLPGQYITLKVAPAKINMYSLAAAPKINRIELIVDISPGKEGSQFIKNLQVGDEVQFLGPFGNFTLQNPPPARHHLFMATGSGIAPLKSMVDSLLVNPRDTTPISLYFGLRYPEDIFLKDYFDRLAHAHPRFKFFLSLSKPDEKWDGEIGHITELIKRDFENTSQITAYLCGTGQMIYQATEILKTLGTPESQIRTEKFFDTT